MIGHALRTLMVLAGTHLLVPVHAEQINQNIVLAASPVPAAFANQVQGGTLITPHWQPDPSIMNPPTITGIVTYPELVVLEYNCAYMVEICANIHIFDQTMRGRARTASNVGSVFHFDMNPVRNDRRRDESCPSGWGGPNAHVCPETGNPAQTRPWRNDGQWFTTALQNPPNFYIQDEVQANGQIRQSLIRYSCEEWPPASFIEGGTSTNTGNANYPREGAASTRCAAQRCGPKGSLIKAEQDWQGTSHQNLKNALKALITSNLAKYPNWDTNDISNNFAVFKLALVQVPMAAYAARVLVYPDRTMNTPATSTRIITQARRRSTREDYDNHIHWMNNVTMEELDDNYSSEQIHILVNGTEEAPVARFRFKPGGVPWDHVEPTFADASDRRLTPLHRRASPLDIEKARAIVEDALAKTAILNAARYANPLRNKYQLEPGTIIGKRSDEIVPPLLNITDEIAAAAALVAEVDAVAQAGNGSKRATAASGSFWMQSIARKGTVPFGNDPNYKVFRNVLDYGAVGDGTTDDTDAIKRAMTDGNRCGKGCNGSTTKNAIVYFPPGKYLVSTTIPLPFGTQVIGDANSWPTVIASKTFIGLGVLSTDEYTGGGIGSDGLDQEYYINTANFYRQIRNMRIDVTQTRSASQVAGLHYQVAQATSLQNLELIANSATKQRGIFAENGSGGVMSDITFTGGAFGLYGGNQQFTAQRLTFNGCATGVQVIWDWGWVWKSITMNNVDVGFRLLQENKTSTSTTKRQAGKSFNGNIGSAAFMDSTFNNVNTAILIAPTNPKTGSGSTGLIVENVKFSGGKAVGDTSGATLLASSQTVDSWVLGPAYSPGRSWSSGAKVGTFSRRAELIDSSGKYFERAKPQYETSSPADFLHVKDVGAKGDGSTDDTSAFQNAINQAVSQSKILFVDAGSYILTGTVTVPPGAKIVGELWSQLVASGSYFSDANNPKVMLKVGNEGDSGTVEMQDLLFTTRGATAGLIMVQWNIRGSSQGAAALWDCHARIGGAVGTQLTPKECPASTSGTNSGCNAASLMMHISPSGAGYFDNMWLWVADHMIDDTDTNDANNTMTQMSVYVARGLLVESTQPTWFYGTASEHAVFYQYNFNKAKSIFAGMIQTESPYYQPVPKPPAPFTSNVGKISGDPDYTCSSTSDELSGCDASWAVIIRQSANIHIAGAGLYSWFSAYTQDCIDNQTCQKALVLLKSNVGGVRFQNLITIGAKYMIAQDGTGIKAIDNLNVNTHPSWSQVSVFDANSNGTDPGQLLWLDPIIWKMDEPKFTCSPPCTVKVPPWTGATSTYNYPFVTVSSGAWTSVITRQPQTQTEVYFEAVTLTAAAAAGGKRQAATGTAFWPKPMQIPRYPAAVYQALDGATSTATPTDKFPTPVASIGPNASPPPQGAWPKRSIQAIFGNSNNPFVENCSYGDPLLCQYNPFLDGLVPGILVAFEGLLPDGTRLGDPGDTGEPWDYFTCPAASSSSTMTQTPTQTASQPPPSNTPIIDKDVVKCYNGGASVNREQMLYGIRDLCAMAAGGGGGQGIMGGMAGSKKRATGDGYVYKAGAHLQSITKFTGNKYIIAVMDVYPNCEYVYTDADCRANLIKAVDECNTSGVNHKQGGVITNNCQYWRIDPNTGSG